MTAGEPRKASHARLTFTAAGLLAVTGLAAWFVMPRAEDPRFPARYAALTVGFPGASASDVERLIVEPLEDELAQVDSVRHIDSTARANYALLVIELEDDVYDTDSAWDEARRAIAEARRRFPVGTTEPSLDTRLVNPESIVLAVTGSTNPLVLREGARRIKRALLHVQGVGRVKIVGDPGEQITIEYDEAAAQRLGVAAPVLAAQLASRNVTIPGGGVRMGDTTVTLRPEADFASLEELEATPIALPAGGAVPLREIARVRRGPEDPPGARMRYAGQMAVGITVMPRHDSNLVELGERVRAVVAAERSGLRALTVHEVSFQPDYVDQRLSGLSASLLLSMLIVSLVLLSMGRRPALVVATVVPLVTLSSLAIYWMGGGVLQQISVAAMVIAIGMLVDNAVVVVEFIQARIDAGEDRLAAARRAVRELWKPLTSTTLTTVAAFVPMMLASGATADFVRALPIVISLALLLSLGYAMFVTPVFCSLFLRKSVHQGRDRLATVAAAVARAAVRHHRKVLAAAAGLVLVALGSSLLLQEHFFPAADRNQFVVELRLPEGTHLDGTDRAALRVERALLAHRGIASVATFVGQGVPRFYYNVPNEPHAPAVAQLLVTTTDESTNAGVMAWVRRFLGTALPGVEGVVRRLDQGPAMVAPIEVRIYGDDPRAADAASSKMLSALRSIRGATDIRRDLDAGSPTVRIAVADAAASRHAVARIDVARALLGQTRGLPVGEFRGGEETVPIVLRSGRGEALAVEQLPAVPVSRPDGSHVPLGQLARTQTEWAPAVIRHRDGQTVTRVLSELSEGTSFGSVVAALQERVGAMTLPASVTIEYGGMAQGAGEANASLLRVAPIGLLLIIACLMWEFRSFRRMGIVLTTVPLGAVGIVPGLLIGGQPFGFMALLGIVGLLGIVVDGASILLDVVERNRAAGLSIPDALTAAVRTRTRPIVLMVGTNIVGLIPLTFSGSTLWEPLAWAMMSGLFASTLLTLLVVPALYRALIREQEIPTDEDTIKFDIKPIPKPEGPAHVRISMLS